MQFQWYPGHMTKAKRMMQEDMKLVDLVIELVDARIPMSSRNPDIDELGKNNARLILMNKADLADDKKTEQWMDYFKGRGFYAVKLDSRKKNGMKSVQNVIAEACKEKTERDRKRGDLEPSGARDGRGDPECRKIDFYQYFCGESVYQDRKQTGCYERKTVDPAQ